MLPAIFEMAPIMTSYEEIEDDTVNSVQCVADKESEQSTSTFSIQLAGVPTACPYSAKTQVKRMSIDSLVTDTASSDFRSVCIT